MTALVIVESPAKAKTINKYLGRNYDVIASLGHVRDLPSKNGSVDPEHDFAMMWESDGRGKKSIQSIVTAAKNADKIILATDPDREGEAISWHILEVLDQKKVLKGKAVERVAFHEITKSAVLDAVANPRKLDQQLVDAYLARRALDYLVGFTLSPVLWRKLPGARSAGRVQSVALRLICEREQEIEDFDPQEYWTITGLFANLQNQNFSAGLTHLNGSKLKKFDINTETLAKDAEKVVKQGPYKIAKIERKTVSRNPAPPFTTSTLQQEAARKLGFSATRTMRTAQKLYEGVDIGGETVGLITYMRTDGVQLSQDALAQARSYIQKTYGGDYLPEGPRYYKSRAKNSQEAHEAIRPTAVERTPQQVAKSLSDDEARLYELIWKRMLACQMQAARLDQVAADLVNAANTAQLRATGSTIAFDGFIRVYWESTDEDSDNESDDKILPPLKEGDSVTLNEVKPEQHFTKPPPRYTEASLVKKLEELGIGRPSTYASILQVLQDRNYVRLEQKKFIPEDRGRIVTAFLENFFRRYVEYDFTANLEEKLDQISAGDIDWKDVLRDFWTNFKGAVDETQDLRVSDVLEALNRVLGKRFFPRGEDGEPDRTCPACKTGQLSIKVGKNGAFIGCSNYPECNYTRPLTAAEDGDGMDGLTLPHDLGKHPETGDMISLRLGPYGLYVQMGEGDKPKRASLPKGLNAPDVTLEKAVELLRLPREIGPHPETGEMIIANTGRFGPYIGHGGVFASIKDPEELFTIGLNRAVTLLAEKEKKMDRHLIGQHPKTKKPIYTQKARFGYVLVYNTKKVGLTKKTDPKSITLEEALDMLAPKKKKKKAE